MLTEDVDTDYEPFVPDSPSIKYQSPVKAVGDNGSANNIISNGNLLNIEKNASVEKYGTKVTTDENGIITINGTSTVNTYVQLSGNEIKISNSSTGISPNLSLPKQKLKLVSKKINGNVNSGIHFYLVERSSGTNSHNQHISNIQNSEDVKTVDVDLTDADIYKFISYLYFAKDTTFDNAKFQLQLKQEQVSTDYIPHEEQNILVPVQQPMLEGDYSDLDRGKEVHVWEKKVLDGTTEKWNIGSAPNQENTTYFTTSYSNSNIGNDTINLKCENLKVDTAYYVWSNDVEIIGQSKSQIVMRLNKDRASTVEKLQEYLKAHPITVYVKKETPTELDLTPEQKTALEELKNVKTYKDVTHVYSIDEISPIFKTEHYLPLGQINEVSSKSNVEEPSAEEKMDMPSIEENFVEDSEDTVEEVE